MKTKTHEFPIFEDGLFTDLVKEFILYKRACGLSYEDSAVYVLRQICKQLNQNSSINLELTQAMVFKIVGKRPHERHSTHSRRITYIRQFAIYLNRKGYSAYIYPECSIHKEETTFVPYLFSEREIESIMDVADSLPKIRKYPQYHMVYPVLVRILYSCGLRLSEALHLKVKHYDSKEKTLFIEKAKNFKSRMVPISESMALALTSYLKTRLGNHPAAERYIFEAPDGNAYNRSSVRCTIYNIFKIAGLPHNIKEHHPNVHSFRHNFAVRAMEKMQSEGMDLYCTLPVLATFLGHKGVRETERYLRLPASRMSEIANANDNLVEGMIPEVLQDEI